MATGLGWTSWCSSEVNQTTANENGTCLSLKQECYVPVSPLEAWVTHLTCWLLLHLQIGLISRPFKQPAPAVLGHSLSLCFSNCFLLLPLGHHVEHLTRFWLGTSFTVIFASSTRMFLRCSKYFVNKLLFSEAALGPTLCFVSEF